MKLEYKLRHATIVLFDRSCNAPVSFRTRTLLDVLSWTQLWSKSTCLQLAANTQNISQSILSIFASSMSSFEEFLHVLYQWQWLPILTVLFVIYITYYLFHVVQKPRLIGKEGPFREFVLQSCPMLSEYYWPTFWCFGGRAQTVIRALARSRPSVPFRR